MGLQKPCGRKARQDRKKTIVCFFLLGMLLYASLSIPSVHAGTRTSPINMSINWLVTHQQSSGSYGFYTDPQAAPAGNALWVRNQSSPNALLAYQFLKKQIQNATTWFWGNGGSPVEADVPGEILYSFAASQHLQMLNLSFVGPKLLNLQQSNGGFLGYLDPAQNKQVTSSVDTAMALWGLINSKSISATKQTSATNYLLSLQNTDGSFNLTKTVRSDALYSLGPEPISITALVVLVLRDASFGSSNSHVSLAMSYLAKAAGSSFNGHVFAASLSTLAFTVYDNSTLANTAARFVQSQQTTTGGFTDTIRSSTNPNALDTGWATIALELGGLTGNVNLDGTVDISDLVTVGAASGSTIGSPSYLPRADVNADGTVDITDLVLVASNFGKTADSL